MLEGVELCVYIDGDSHSYPLTDMQIAVIGKILGLQLSSQTMSCFSDDTLKQFFSMKGNPLRLKEKDQE